MRSLWLAANATSTSTTPTKSSLYKWLPQQQHHHARGMPQKAASSDALTKLSLLIVLHSPRSINK